MKTKPRTTASNLMMQGVEEADAAAAAADDSASSSKKNKKKSKKSKKKSQRGEDDEPKKSPPPQQRKITAAGYEDVDDAVGDWRRNVRSASGDVIASTVVIDGKTHYYTPQFTSGFNPSQTNKHGNIQVDWYSFLSFFFCRCLDRRLLSFLFIIISLVSLDNTSTERGELIPQEELFNCRILNLFVHGGGGGAGASPQRVLLDKCMAYWICSETGRRMWGYVSAAYTSLCNVPHVAFFIVPLDYDRRNGSTGSRYHTIKRTLRTSNCLLYAPTEGVNNYVLGSAEYKRVFGPGGLICDPSEPIPDWMGPHFVDFAINVRKR